MKPTNRVYRTELTPVSFLERSAYVFPDKVAVVHGDRRYTYRQLEERVNRLASALRRAGLGKHDRVGFICPNIPAMLEAHYGVPGAGGVLVAINIRLGSDEIEALLNALAVVKRIGERARNRELDVQPLERVDEVAELGGEIEHPRLVSARCGARRRSSRRRRAGGRAHHAGARSGRSPFRR